MSGELAYSIETTEYIHLCKCIIYPLTLDNIGILCGYNGQRANCFSEWADKIFCGGIFAAKSSTA